MGNRVNAPQNQPVQRLESNSAAGSAGEFRQPPPLQLAASSSPTGAENQELGGQGTQVASTAGMSQLDHALHLIDLFEAESGSPRAWSRIGKGEFIRSLRERTARPFGIDQMALQACGPAAFAFGWAESDPHGFAEFMITLYKYGEGNLGNRVVDPRDGLLDRRPGDQEWRDTENGHHVNNVVDFMVLASLRSDKVLVGRDFEDPSDQLDGISFPHDMVDWLRGTESFDPIRNRTSTIRGNLSFRHFKNQVHAAHHEGFKVFMFINSQMISQERRGQPISSGEGQEGTQVASTDTGGDSVQAKADPKASQQPGAPIQAALAIPTAIHHATRESSLTPDHWVIYRGNLVESEDFVTFDVWTWGKAYRVSVDKNYFVEHYYGAVLAKPV